MKTICPKCKSFNDTDVGELDTHYFAGMPYLWYPKHIICFFCGEWYVWNENLHRKWEGTTIPKDI